MVSLAEGTGKSGGSPAAIECRNGCRTSAKSIRYRLYPKAFATAHSESGAAPSGSSSRAETSAGSGGTSAAGTSTVIRCVATQFLLGVSSRGASHLAGWPSLVRRRSAGRTRARLLNLSARRGGGVTVVDENPEIASALAKLAEQDAAAAEDARAALEWIAGDQGLALITPERI